jgi:hypothetical protein
MHNFPAGHDNSDGDEYDNNNIDNNLINLLKFMTAGINPIT